MPEAVEARAITPEDLLEGYTLVEELDGVMVVTKQLQDMTELSFGELGVTGSSFYDQFMRRDYNPKFNGIEAIRTYDEMKRSDSQVRASLRVMKMPILGARWYMKPVSRSTQDLMISEFIWNCFTKWMSVTFNQLLWEALLMLDYGYYVFEKVYDIRMWKGHPRIYWRKFAPRHPIDIQEWVYSEEDGGPLGIWYTDFNKPGGRVFIPMDKLAAFTFEREAGDMTGVSALRSAYKHWYFKDNLYKVDAIQKERHGIGIPVVNLPEGYTPHDKQLAREMARNLRTNEKAYAVLPPRWELMFLKPEGMLVDPMASAEVHGRMIYENILGQMMKLTQARVDTAADQNEDFAKALRYVADIVRDVFNWYCIPQLVNWNWTVEEYPSLMVRRIGDTTDWRTLSFALRNFVGAKLIQPDEPTEQWIRDEMDLPDADPETVREIIPDLEDLEDQARLEAELNAEFGGGGGFGGGGPNAQRGGQAGMPRQSAGAGNRQGRRAGTANAGTDGSGG
jgi:hypothetical protein